ncbi:hypothetical protein CLAFUW4_13689 [Fulvia fulva]|uniref:DUF7587 domain-containing protein n=1 Tax=Passalora fulva TaxID=5499 RepID=A0A9Q8PL37_PASFU|nr:uncharacterized protein CLAFUR5_13538 [Fulvia fulva]KAK4610433.1 hypothetical protein CLAFUR4_13692 [Fulvia fulva]KAK4610858.1 hypothetical protein CLAFUR0_13696 [Fulvia fulva]UJO24407.1 hypothetical protein CLAFUR5_13538 [Fulvia fulva]WPV21693.1 hypothetical protein CLAFUW4_13689 [Fulvia fulva]WPV36820.1 hypothetical protein CLAFUW7_13697 [Fulvia fulva]
MGSAKINDELKQTIQKRMQTGTPRFLFRVWHAESGGTVGLNTINRITPLRFRLNPTHSRNFFDNSIEDLAQTAEDHIQSGKIPEGTMYSSWTQSLPQALVWACIRLKTRSKHLHLCILDTRELSSAQVVLHTYAMRELLSEKISEWVDYELLAYGPLEGPVYKAVPLNDIPKVDLERFYAGFCQNMLNPKVGEGFFKKGDAASLLSAASDIGRLFGEYSLPMQVHLLSCMSHTDINHATIVDALSGPTVPEEWLDDPDPTDLDVAGHTEAQRAAIILRDLAIRAHRRGLGVSTSGGRQDLQKSQELKRTHMLAGGVTPHPMIPKHV